MVTVEHGNRLFIISLKHHTGEVIAACARAWALLWFQEKATTPLEIVRIGISIALLVHYGFATPHLFEFWGNTGYLPLALALETAEPSAFSLLFHLTAPWQLVAFHGVFLSSCLALLVGWRTSWVKWIVFVGKISYEGRNPTIAYGADIVVCSLLFILCFSPIGRSLSLDRVRAVRQAKRADLGASAPPYISGWAGAGIRLMQIQMAVLFFYTGVSKIKWEEWRDGDAVWLVFITNEYYNTLILDLFARQYWLSNIATYATIFIEVAYPFLIWQERTRPYMLAAAVALHIQFAIFLSLIHFSFVMIMGHMSFLSQDWLTALGAWWKLKMGAMDLIYDGRSAAAKRSMAWLLAFDGLQQINIRDFRTQPSPFVNDVQLDKAPYLIRPDGRILPDVDAYRHIAFRVPGLWWLIPLLYVPLLSRLLGTRLIARAMGHEN
jgi:hypothetical protein